MCLPDTPLRHPGLVLFLPAPWGLLSAGGSSGPRGSVSVSGVEGPVGQVTQLVP